MPSAYKFPQLAFAVFGVVMLLLYRLALVWPSARSALEPQRL
jgi:hypothetical protein